MTNGAKVDTISLVSSLHITSPHTTTQHYTSSNMYFQDAQKKPLISTETAAKLLNRKVEFIRSRMLQNDISMDLYQAKGLKVYLLTWEQFMIVATLCDPLNMGKSEDFLTLLKQETCHGIVD